MLQHLVAAMDPNAPPPAWLPYVFLAIPVVIMLILGRWAVRHHAGRRVARRREARRRGSEGVMIGSSAQIADSSEYTVGAMLIALAVQSEEEATRGAPDAWDTGYMGRMLGLKVRVGQSTEVAEANVFWGVRNGRQVHVRLGADEALEGSTTMFSNRHVRSITTLRVAAPPAEIDGRSGRLACATDDASPLLRGVLDTLAPSDVWAEVRIISGAEGIVASRPLVSDHLLMSWVHDLWLLEHIAGRLNLEPLSLARIGPAWSVPYGAGRRA